MAPRAKGVRLWLRPARIKEGRVVRRATWIIKDVGKQFATGFWEGEKLAAELALQKYIEGRPIVVGAQTNQCRQTYIYFITATNREFPIKIGLTQSGKSRFGALQTALPYDLQILGCYPIEGPAAEKMIHNKFNHLRLRGEWFERAPELMEFIQGLSPKMVIPTEIAFQLPNPPMVHTILEGGGYGGGIKIEGEYNAASH